jgi:long-chain acyl-CoA synthetase
VKIFNGWGMTETSSGATSNTERHHKFETVGKPLPGVEIRIAEDGEVLVLSPGNMLGYFRNEAATTEVLKEGWMYSGDIGELDEDGFLRITDRKKDLIITAGGKNISPGNIEGALGTHPLIGHAVAIGDRRPYMTALLTLDPEEAPGIASQHGWPSDLEQLAQHQALRDELQRHVDAVNSNLSHVEQVKRFAVLPKDFTPDEELTPTLKVKRKVVAEKYADQIEELYKK